MQCDRINPGKYGMMHYPVVQCIKGTLIVFTMVKSFANSPKNVLKDNAYDNASYIPNSTIMQV